MKKLSYIFALLAVFALWTACEKEEDKVILDVENAVAPSLVNPGALVFTEDEKDEPLTIEWSDADYGLNDLQLVVSYRLQIKHADSTAFIVLATTSQKSYSTTVGSLNNRLVNAGYQVDEELDFHMQVLAFVNDMGNGTLLQSQPSAVSVTLFEAAGEPEAAMLWVPGDYQGWSPETAPNLYSPEDNGIYTGYIHMESGSGMFKFITEPTWASGIHYGTGGEGILDPAGGDLSVPENGTWYFTANTEDLTWTHQMRTFSLIGSFNDWAGDEPLTWDNDEKVLTVTREFDAGTEFKWRVNADWAINYGLGDGDYLVQGGDNLVLEEGGNYTINLNLYGLHPTYEIIAN